MNRNINSRLAIATVAFIAAALATLFIIIEKREVRIIQESQESAVFFHKSTSRVATVDDNEIQSEDADEWKLVSGKSDDICTIPVYEGTAKIHGWYVYDVNYEKKKEWLLRISDEDISKLPLFENNRSKKDFHLRVKLDDASPELEKKLKNASPENPVEVQISRYLAYCEGVSVANIKAAENI